MEIALFHAYAQQQLRCEALAHAEQQRAGLATTAQLLKTVLIQQQMLDSSLSKDSHAQTSLKQEMTKANHDKKLLENKVTLLQSEVEVQKKKSQNNVQLQRENAQLKTQISKLNTQLSESQNTVGRVKQQFVTQKAALESKLDTAKRSIKTLKDKERSPQKSSILSPQKNGVVPKTLVSSLSSVKPFSVSPFVKNRLSPTKPNKPSTPMTVGKIMAQSTPGGATTPLSMSPLKDMKPKRPSSLKNVISGEPKKPSLFDDDDDEDDDGFFSQAVKPVAAIAGTTITAGDAEKHNDVPGDKQNQAKKRKKKIGGKIIVEDDEDLKFSPLKKVKLMDRLGGISPLKQRNKERGLFKV